MAMRNRSERGGIPRAVGLIALPAVAALTLAPPASAARIGAHGNRSIGIVPSTDAVYRSYPNPGSDTEASILPPPNGSMGATNVFAALEKVGQVELPRRSRGNAWARR